MTDTAPGHAALYTAMPPSQNGIYTNEYIAENRTRASVLRDDATHLIPMEKPQAVIDAVREMLSEIR